MKIAQVAPLLVPIPPLRYGGIERVITELSTRLADRGHEITIFGSAKSRIHGKRISFIPCSPFPTRGHAPAVRHKWETEQILNVIARQGEFDAIHAHYEPKIGDVSIDGNKFNLFNFFEYPIVSTFHNQTYIDSNKKYYKEHDELWYHHYVFLSENHRKPLKFLPNTHVIYNGIPVEKFIYDPKPMDYMMFLGRITPEKGIAEAIEVAKLTGMKLIVGAATDPEYMDFFHKKIEPQFDGKQIIWVGEMDFQQKMRYLKNAICLLFPINWEEPFGLVIAEAMAAGVPVIGFRRGSVPELVQNGINGFVVDNVKEMAEAVEKIPEIDRKKCRETAENNYHVERMIDDYEKLYRDIIKEKANGNK